MPVFFDHTKAFVDANSRLFDFLWTSAAALWNLRWQVDGLSRTLGGYSNAHATSRFVSGSAIHGVNLKRVCLDDSWEENKLRLAQIALTLGVANFEGWLSETVSIFHMGSGVAKKDRHARESLASSLQKPTEYANALTTLAGAISPTITKCIAPLLAIEHANAVKALPNLVKVYRHFKDLRNKIAHEGGVADTQIVQSHLSMSGLTPADLGMKEVPETEPVVFNVPVALTLRGVVGVTGVIVRIVKAYDAQLAVSEKAEAELIARWKAEWGLHNGAYVLPAGKRHEKIARRCRHLGLPTPKHLGDLDALLRSHRLAME